MPAHQPLLDFARGAKLKVIAALPLSGGRAKNWEWVSAATLKSVLVKIDDKTGTKKPEDDGQQSPRRQVQQWNRCDDLAHETRLSEKSVRRALQVLESMGLISITDTQVGGKRRLVTRIQWELIFGDEPIAQQESFFVDWVREKWPQKERINSDMEPVQFGHCVRILYITRSVTRPSTRPPPEASGNARTGRVGGWMDLKVGRRESGVGSRTFWPSAISHQPSARESTMSRRKSAQPKREFVRWKISQFKTRTCRFPNKNTRSRNIAALLRFDTEEARRMRKLFWVIHHTPDSRLPTPDSPCPPAPSPPPKTP